MKKLHIANIQIEMEQEVTKPQTLESSFLLHRNLLQLQHLPSIYSDDAYYILGEEFKEPHILEPWGHSPLIADWAKKNGHHYDMPNPQVMRLLLSKRFTFENCPQLPNSKLIHSIDDLHFDHYPIILKTEYGFSGIGNKVYHVKPEINDPFIVKELSAGRVLIAEPWVNISLNFSTQYEVERDAITCLGTTRIENNKRGNYIATYTGEEFKNLDKHYEESEKLIKKMQQMGYFGNVGIDAYFYEGNLHPVCEMNPRKTMSYVALKKCQNEKMCFRYNSRGDNGIKLLPNRLEYANKEYHFKLNFYASKDWNTFQDRRGHTP
ncbi:MAG: hypothetical protein P0S95_06090 [Rhabdochlamydiaceae bacterium]|nr:hypothetical protein [Candidatus Amphrikana amoebophyrae]